MLTACLDDENTAAGFSGLTVTTPYANVTAGYLSFASMGDWHMTQNSGADWCNVTCMEGNGNMFYGIPVTLTQNTTGMARTASFRLADNAEGDAYVDFNIGQYATRGDGTLGNAALVKTVTGDDGSTISVTYDELCRPLTLVMEKNGATLRTLSINYSSTDSTIIVTADGGSTLRGTYDNAYQPGTLTSGTDTVGYKSQYSLGSTMAFNVEEHRKNGEYTAQALLLLDNQKLDPDSEHKADSLKYQHRYTDGTTYTEKMALSYSTKGNRNQSLDVNQLLLGIEECNPYVLLSLYKYARNSWIISEAKASDGRFVVEASVNANGSVETMGVTDKNGKKITYTFGY